MRIENWSLVAPLYSAPEEGGYIKGNVYDNPKFPDGHHVVTSAVVNIDPIAKTVTTRSGSVYKLGAVDADWDKEYPDAENRFWNNNPDFTHVD
jgi:hypothetical protein